MNAGPFSAPVIPDTEERWAEVDGHRMRYLRAGNGPAVLLIHGLMAYSFSWRHAIPALAPMRTVIAPDLLGTGFSDQPPDLDVSLTAQAQRLWKFLDDLGVETTDVVGSSLGGGIAVRMTAMSPERVNKLVLAAPINPWSRHGRWITRLLATKFGARMFMSSLPLIRATGDFWLKRLFGDPKRIAPGTFEGYAAPLAKRSAWQYGMAIIGTWRESMRQLQRDYSALGDKKTLLIWGGRDVAVLPQSAQEVASRMKNARLVIMKRVGHIPYDEVPNDFNRELKNFLAE
jgi:pimeloyl-ACP methyl ester carboxylesterase